MLLHRATAKMLSGLSNILLIIYCTRFKSESRIQKELQKRKLKSHEVPIAENSIWRSLKQKSSVIADQGPHTIWHWANMTGSQTVFFGVFLVHILRISPYSVRIRENKYQKNSKYGHFSRSVNVTSSQKKHIAAI